MNQVNNKLSKAPVRSKKLTTFLLLISILTLGSAQEVSYKLLKDIPYQSKALNESDTYIAERCVLDLYYPENIENYPTTVWFHGGGLTGGDKHIPEGLLEQGMAVVAVRYRLYPKIKAPVYIQDAAAAVAWVFKNIASYKGDKSKIFITGHSAGGYLTSMVGLDKSYLAAYDIDANKIAGLIPLSGHTITHFTVRAERGIDGTRPIIDDLAPLYHVRADAPPLLLITGDRELEMLGRYEENAYMMRMMSVVGHKDTRILELDGYGHGIVEPSTPLILREVKRINEEMKSGSLDQPFYVGTYTGGESEGIYKYILKNDGTLERVGLAAVSDNPSFLARSADMKYILAVSEVKSDDNTGAVASFLIEDDGLTFINKTSSGGAHPCFVACNSEGFVLAANYTGGNVGLMRIGEDGVLSELLDVQQHEGSGLTDRQKSPHAHSAWFEPGTQNIISVDLGTNELWFSRLDTKKQKLKPVLPQTLALVPGAGPRHLAFHPNKKWVYVVNELNSSVSLVKRGDNGEFEIIQIITTLPETYKQQNSCADIHVSPDGKFVYASNRGHNSLVIFKVNGENGELKMLGHQSTFGSTPRNFSISPGGKYIVVANQSSNNLVSFLRDSNSGLLQFIDQIEAPKPVCVLF